MLANSLTIDTGEPTDHEADGKSQAQKRKEFDY